METKKRLSPRSRSERKLNRTLGKQLERIVEPFRIGYKQQPIDRKLSKGDVFTFGKNGIKYIVVSHEEKGMTIQNTRSGKEVTVIAAIIGHARSGIGNGSHVTTTEITYRVINN